MTALRLARIGLLISTILVGVTAVAGGAALIVGSLNPSLATVLSPPVEYLEGSPFNSYLAPGVILALVLGGLHLVVFVLVLRRHEWWVLAGAVAAFDALIWIFVQMVFIPFSFLQAFYFAFGLAEAGLVMLALGLLTPAKHHPVHRS
ncbi:hypothetical protein [Pseudolysinimonas yzui]|uniref:Uncharacterized protein n=1 Tax=Pseudolysinimonas yzui TaxID=2708254 RepID=A0A8J3GNR6_9MICO|nr:hypothetical protein [Pseudolysinimonas yzui]GHF07903.1 hypothetical protein GCM10011600_05830 [Pseudolysinimonas yzui]